MTGLRVRSLSLPALLIVLLPARALAACDVPRELLAGRAFPETRRILEGEVLFVADARLHDFEGRTTAVSGLVRANGVAEAVGCVAVDPKSLDTGIGLRNRLMWEDHLEVAKFPEIRFVLTGLADQRKESDHSFVTLEGELTLHGVTRSLRVPVRVRPADRGLAVEGTAAVQMSDYGIERPAFLFITVKDEVQVRFRVLVGGVE